MATFEIRFFKELCDPRGNPHKVLQRAVCVSADDPDQALAAAKDLFCTREKIANWTIHADFFDVRAVYPTPEKNSPAPHD